MMKKALILFTATVAATLTLSVQAQIAASPYAHYDPSVGGSSITMTTNNPAVPNHNPDTNTVYVSQVDDLSGNGYHMTDANLESHVEPWWPGFQFNTGGVFGLDLGWVPFNGSAMNMLDPAEQDALLDMLANPNAAMTIFMVVRVKERNWTSPAFGQILLGNTPFGWGSPPYGVAVRLVPALDGSHAEFRLASSDLVTGDEMKLRFGEQAILAIVYDDNLGAVGYWRFEIAGSATSDDFREGTAVGSGIPGGADLSGANSLAIGGSPVWVNIYTDCSVGEILMYDRYIDPATAEYSNTISTLAAKWNTTAPAPPPEMNVEVTNSTIEISWNGPSTVEQATDLVASNWMGTVGGATSPFVVDLTTVSAPQDNWRLGTAPPLFSPAGPMIIQYDPSIASTIHFATSDGIDNTAYPSGTVYVASIDDQTVNGLDAIENGLDILNPPWGYAKYPSSNPFSTGADGVDSVDANNRGTPFRVLDASQSDYLLDFSGAATNRGYTIFITMNVEGDFGGNQSILSNDAFPNQSPFGIYRNGQGQIAHQFLAHSSAALTAIDSVLVGTETVIAAGYDDTTGEMFVANRNSAGPGSSSLSITTNATTGLDVSHDLMPLTLACSPIWQNFRHDATYGEVRIYDEYYAPTGATYSNIMSTLEAKWLTP